jgi:hypothetical protein
MRGAEGLPALLELTEDFRLTGDFAFESRCDAQKQIVSIDAAEAIDASVFCRGGAREKRIACASNQKTAQTSLDAELLVAYTQKLKGVARRLALLALVNDKKLVENHARMLRGGL